MKARQTALLTALTAAMAFAVAPSHADVSFFGTAKVKPTFYQNFDFDKDKPDAATLNEGGWTSGPHLRSEIRLGWAAKGDDWSVKMIAESDVIMEKDTADRSFGVGAEKEKQTNSGGEFGIERLELLKTIAPGAELETGWDIRSMDIKTGGLVFGDDHPFLGVRGAVPGEKTSYDYELLYVPIQNRDKIGVSDSPNAGDWTAYMAKGGANLKLDGGTATISPFYVRSSNRDKKADVNYFGVEAYGQFGMIKPSLELVAVNGSFSNSVGGADISSFGAYAAAVAGVSKSFSPFVAFRFAQGDDDKTDGKAKGFVGITDISRFTPVIGMDGSILGEHLASGASIYNSPLYSYSPERAVGGNVYGGIGNASSGNNPGQRLIAVGATGDLSSLLARLSYKTQAFFIWYDKPDNLVNVKTPGKKVDSYAGTTLDLQLKYDISKNFAVDYIFSTFVPGQGIQDQVNAKDAAYVNSLTLAWAY